MPAGTDFHHSIAREPHRERTKYLLKAHPEIRDLIGKNPMSFVFLAGLVGLQVALAWLVSTQPWWVILIVAYLVGAFANHALFVLIHECAHNLIFRRKAANSGAGIIANLPHRWGPARRTLSRPKGDMAPSVRLFAVLDG